MPAIARIRTVTYSKETKKSPVYKYDPVTARSIRFCRICPVPPSPIVGDTLDGGSPFGSGPFIYDGGTPGSVGSLTLDGGIVWLPRYDGGSPDTFSNTFYDGGNVVSSNVDILDGGNS
jgi:hypothetical protein